MGFLSFRRNKEKSTKHCKVIANSGIGGGGTTCTKQQHTAPRTSMIKNSNSNRSTTKKQLSSSSLSLSSCYTSSNDNNQNNIGNIVEGGTTASSSSYSTRTRSNKNQDKKKSSMEVQTQYYQQDSSPTVEIKVVGQNKHVTTSTVDDLGRYIQKTIVTPLAYDAVKIPKRTESGAAAINLFSSSSSFQEEEESVIDDMTIDPHAEFFNFMDPEYKPPSSSLLKKKKSRSKNNNSNNSNDQNNNNSSSTSLLFEDFMKNDGTIAGIACVEDIHGTIDSRGTGNSTTSSITANQKNKGEKDLYCRNTINNDNKTEALTAKTSTGDKDNNDDNESDNQKEKVRYLVKTFIGKIWNHGDVDYIPNVCTSSIRFNNHDGLERVGHDGFKTMVLAVRHTVHDYNVNIRSMVVENNKCFCRLQFTGRHVGGELLGYKPPSSITSQSSVTSTTKASSNTPPQAVLNWSGASEFTICPKRNQIMKVWEISDIQSLEKQLKEGEQLVES